jgi:hypothetical protein
MSRLSRDHRPSAERSEDRAGKEQLQRSRETARAVPAETVVKELPSTWTQERKDVLEVRGRACRRTNRGGIERASPHGEEKEARETADDLEPRRVDVLVRQAIAREVEDRPDEKRLQSRPTGSACGSPCCDVERDDHARRSLPEGQRCLAPREVSFHLLPVTLRR